MATFTTRPVKAGLPTLFEIEEATEPAGASQHSLNELKLRRFEVVALVAIDDQLDEATEQLSELVKLGRELVKLGRELVEQRRELLDVLREGSHRAGAMDTREVRP